MKKLKIRICTFDVAKYGGIVQNVEGRVKAFKEMGHDVDIIFLTYNKSISVDLYHRRIKEFEDGVFQAKQSNKSQHGGFEKSEVTGYWKNSYYGWFLPPYTNRIPVFAENAIDLWHEAVMDADLLFWSFMPTKTKEAKGFSDWPKFFDLPNRIKQVFAVHDGYYDVRTSWVRYLAPKITYLDCVHTSAYNCCENIGIPRHLNFASRYIPEKLPYKSMSERPIDFFAAHVFKSMKKMEDILAMTPHLKKGTTVLTAGSGIELYYMMADAEGGKQKPRYMTSKKTDPDCLDEEIGMSLWERAEKYGLEHQGFMSSSDVYFIQQNAKFCIDPSFSKHYAQYSNTHLNGFTIEAIINGSYPVLRDTRGLVKQNREIDDIIYDELRAIFIPWNATPKEFAKALEKAKKMSDEQYKKDVKHNFKLAQMLFDPINNMQDVIDIAFSKNRLRQLEVGTDSIKVLKDSEDVMTKFFNVDLPIEWSE
jgi:hypothetical protein